MLERAITNLGNRSAPPITRGDKKVHQTIERLTIYMPTRFKHVI